MPAFHFILIAFSPKLLIPRPEWQVLWDENEKSYFKVASRALSVTFCLLYFFHYFLVDLPAHKEPIQLWAMYRFTVAGVAAGAFLITFTDWFRTSKFSKVPLFICIFYTVYMQGQSMIWRSQVPFFYVPLFATFGVFAMRLPIMGTLLVYSLILFGCRESFTCRPDELHHMVSASMVGAIILIVTRAGMKSDLEKFLLDRRHQEAQKNLIESKIALVDQLRSFLPKVLFLRVENLMNKQRMTPLQAVDEIISPHKNLVSVLYSDIRGFTGITKLGDDALLNSIVPSQKITTDAIEAYEGVPRHQGDLVYAYFDFSNPLISLVNAIKAAVRIYNETERLNLTSEKGYSVKRFSIISFGPAIIGNLGGTDGARDISILGKVSIIPARIDPLTKAPEISNFLKTCPIILTSEAANLLNLIYPDLKLVQFSIIKHGLVIRDFPEEVEIFGVAPLEAESIFRTKRPIKVDEVANLLKNLYDFRSQNSLDFSKPEDAA